MIGSSTIKKCLWALAFGILLTACGGGGGGNPGGGEPTIDEDLPIANAGTDQEVNENQQVQLNGSASSDPKDRSLIYSWTQVSGTSVALSASINPGVTFVAPELVSNETLVFALVVNNGVKDSAEDRVAIQVTAENDIPIANAGEVQEVMVGDIVRLNGSESTDPENTALTYAWIQTGGTPVQLSDTTVAMPQFTAPQLNTNETLTFQLTVSDGVNTSTAVTVSVSITAGSEPPANEDLPIASAGADQEVNENQQVQLNGSASSDPKNRSLTYSWTQVFGAPVTLSDTTNPSVTFVVPDLTSNETLVFALVVNNGVKDSAEDRITIQVTAENDIPTANAGEDQDVMAGEAVRLNGGESTDPENLALTYTWAQTAGTPVQLSDTTAAMPQFSAPQLNDDQTLTFQLTVSDGVNTSTPATVNVLITAVVLSVSVGTDKPVWEGSKVSLIGSVVHRHGQETTLTWTQTDNSGIEIPLANNTSDVLTFSVPDLGIGIDEETLEFTLSATDGTLQASDSIAITVQRACPNEDQGREVFGTIGDGSESYGHAICNVDMLQAFADQVNQGDNFHSQHVALGTTIDLTGIYNWTPIGGKWGTACNTVGTTFNGTFDGYQHTIKNLNILQSDIGCYGLFGHSVSASFKNLVLESFGVISELPSRDNAAGGLVAYAKNTSVDNVSSIDGFVKGDTNVGGLVGLGDFISMTNSSSTEGSVSGNMNVGGLVGRGNLISITNSSNAEGSVLGSMGSMNVGGLIGKIQDPAEPITIDSKISDSHTSTTLVSGTSYVGGLGGDIQAGVTSSYVTATTDSAGVLGTDRVGGLFGKVFGSVSNSYSTATVVGKEIVGGLIGESLATVSNSYVDNIIVSAKQTVGGLIGSADGSILHSYAKVILSQEDDVRDNIGGLAGISKASIYSSYAIAAVKGRYKVGGLIGENSGAVTHAYSIGDVTGRSWVGGLIGEHATNLGIFATYSSGDVNGASAAGGLIADSSTTDVVSSFWNTDRVESAQIAVLDNGLGMAVNNAELGSRETFTNRGWDFVGEQNNGREDIWNIDSSKNCGYPYIERLGYPDSLPVSVTCQKDD